ncbi:hypothetical protein QVD17_07918 [Tagetes erecta]|uniref:Peptidase A1 domain-containing protein n=1 Tax=Tagetes erecta TaxID=13708 RepID=A0AAD8KXF4_TARER|nr:hypothetical protein QVD17_07918 [Tagetes erecta]
MGFNRVFVVAIWLFVVSLVVQFGARVSGNVVFQVYHKFTGENKSLNEYMEHDTFRHRRILSGADLPIGGDNSPMSAALYFTKIRIGSPPRDYHVQVDTGSDLLWVNCAGCTTCPKKSGLGIPLSLYDPELSTSSKTIMCEQDTCSVSLDPSNHECIFGTRCMYIVRYGDGSSTTGYFVRDTVQLNRISGNLQTAEMKGSIMFGCGSEQQGGLGQSQQALDGILGFGQANTSIISQLASSKKVKKMFSHCLSGSKGGIFAIGEVDHPKVNSTPMLPNMMHFTIELKAIDIGGEFVHMQYTFNPTAKRATIIDSGTTLAYLPQDVYAEIMHKVMSAQPNAHTHTPDHQFTCYNWHGNIDDAFPTITFHFANSLKLIVPPHQYMFKTSHHYWCIGFLSSGLHPRAGSDTILLGDIVLKDRLVTYNMEDQTVGWTDYDCSSSIKVKDEESGKVYEVGAHDISWAGKMRGLILLWLVLSIAIIVVMY